jgi:hypothetical protein
MGSASKRAKICDIVRFAFDPGDGTRTASIIVPGVTERAKMVVADSQTRARKLRS